MKKAVAAWYRLSLAAARSALELNLRPLREEMLLARLQAEFALEPVHQDR